MDAFSKQNARASLIISRRELLFSFSHSLEMYTVVEVERPNSEIVQCHHHLKHFASTFLCLVFNDRFILFIIKCNGKCLQCEQFVFVVVWFVIIHKCFFLVVNIPHTSLPSTLCARVNHHKHKTKPTTHYTAFLKKMMTLAPLLP